MGHVDQIVKLHNVWIDHDDARRVLRCQLQPNAASARPSPDDQQGGRRPSPTGSTLDSLDPAVAFCRFGRQLVALGWTQSDHPGAEDMKSIETLSPTIDVQNHLDSLRLFP